MGISFKVSFANLEMSQLDFPDFRITFDSDVRSEVASSAGVVVQDVQVDLFSGSVVVSCVVDFLDTSVGLIQRSTFTAVLRQTNSSRQVRFFYVP